MSQSHETTSLAIARAINAGLREALSGDDNVVLLGQDIASLGGVFRVTEGLAKDYGTARVLDTPLAEAGILGSAVGLAMSGFRPVAEIQFDGFVFPAMNQIVTQLAKLRNRSAGTMNMPVVLRLPYGGHIGAVEHHQESPEAYFAHTAGLRVVSPANANDAYWMIQQAIKSDDPVIFLEPKAKYWQKGEVRLDRPGAALHETLVAREGSDVTLIGFGAMVTTLLQAAEIANGEGVSAEVIDLRTVSPIDYGPIVASVRKTGHVVVAQEAPENASVGSEIAATLSERCFHSLEAPVLRVSGYDTPFPPAGNEANYLPDADRVLAAVDRAMNY
ncbi:MAG: alpha-ketoacid dehydrogenase subunit beta [Leucobacter sp.]|nr:alpha-ketoacid dehydrogenase subunit beta [Leucobacter sp.]